MKYSDSASVKDTQTNTHTSRSSGITGSTKHKVQEDRDTHSKRDEHTHRSTRGATKQAEGSLSRNPLRSSNSGNLKTSKRGAKDVYFGENVMNYFSNLRPGGANRTDLKGKTRTSLGNQEGDKDEITGYSQVDGSKGDPSQLKPKLDSRLT